MRWPRAATRARSERSRSIASERRRGGLEVEHAAVEAARLQRADVLRQRRQRCAARVHADRRLVVACFGEKVDHLEEQRGGEIVDAVVPGVFKDVERDALAGARKPAHHDELHQKSSSPG
jgi:hypothetical protein